MIPGIIDHRTVCYLPETRAVAFLDILGFKKLTDEFVDQPGAMHRLDEILCFAERLLTGDLGIAEHCDVRMFSDCICVTSPVSPRSLVRLVVTLEHLQLQLAVLGIFVRGGVTIGRHYQTPRMIMSQALISAYQLESQVARFPRIVVGQPLNDALSGLSEHDWRNPWKTLRTVPHSPELHIKRDELDDVPFLNYLADLHSVDSVPLFNTYILEHKHSVQNWIRTGVSTEATIAMTAKHQWLIGYHNSAVREISAPHWRDEYEINA